MEERNLVIGFEWPRPEPGQEGEELAPKLIVRLFDIGQNNV